MVVQVDTPARLEAITRQLIACGLRMTDNGRFADFALAHGTHGLSMPCDWLHMEHSEKGAEISFRTRWQYLKGLKNFATDYYGTAWIDQVGAGFMLASNDDHEAWLDFNSGRTVVNFKP